jgi:hypothetical protein
MTGRIPGYSDADMAALHALTAANLALNDAAQELARVIARENGIQLGKLQPNKLRKRGRLRYGNMVWHAPGHVVAEVVNDKTGQVRRFSITKAPDGTIDAEEL